MGVNEEPSAGAFKKELSSYKWSKGAIQFPLDLVKN
jgi:hypothetical protein